VKVNEIVGQCLQREGVKLLTGFPYNQVIDSCAGLGVKPVIARSERVAVNMADGYSRMKAGEEFGVCAVQYGPGIENSFGGLAQAYADAVPMLMIPGGYDSRWAGTHPNFSADRSLRSISKEVMSVNYPERAALMAHRAFGLLRTGKGGPVVLEIPDDIMAADAPFNPDEYTPARISKPCADPREIELLVERIAKANRPIFVAGRGVLQTSAWSELLQLAERLHVPVMTTLTGKSAFPEDHPLALGTGGLSRTGMVDHFLAKADLIVGFGTPFTKSHYVTAMPNGRALVQITDDPIDVSNSYFIDTLIISDVRKALSQLLEATHNHQAKDIGATSDLTSEIGEVKRGFLAKWNERLSSDAEPMSAYRVVTELMQILDRKASCVTHDSGNPRDQIVPFFEALTPLGYLGWGKSTPLGSGLGLIMGAKLAKPEWTCVNIMGDAAIGMVGMDIETAVRCEIPILTIVLNNGLMGGYTYWQPIATEKYKIQYLGGHYADLAKSLGAFGQRVERLRDLRPMLDKAIRATREGRPALVEVMTREEPILAVPEKHA
jgi:thiamine pyrophosphate-dependent acetolactate synthase large subunit-like protein